MLILCSARLHCFGHFSFCLHVESLTHCLGFSVVLLSRGVVFGLWSACASVGNILGACLASSVLQYGYEVGVSFTVCMCTLALAV